MESDPRRRFQFRLVDLLGLVTAIGVAIPLARLTAWLIEEGCPSGLAHCFMATTIGAFGAAAGMLFARPWRCAFAGGAGYLLVVLPAALMPASYALAWIALALVGMALAIQGILVWFFRPPRNR